MAHVSGFEAGTGVGLTIDAARQLGCFEGENAPNALSYVKDGEEI